MEIPEDVSCLKRQQLQKLCKAHGIRANMKVRAQRCMFARVKVYYPFVQNTEMAEALKECRKKLMEMPEEEFHVPGTAKLGEEELQMAEVPKETTGASHDNKDRNSMVGHIRHLRCMSVCAENCLSCCRSNNDFTYMYTCMFIWICSLHACT